MPRDNNDNVPENPENEISVSDLREKLPEFLSRVAFAGESFTVMKHGKRYAVLRPYIDDTEDASPDHRGARDKDTSRGGVAAVEPS